MDLNNEGGGDGDKGSRSLYGGRGIERGYVKERGEEMRKIVSIEKI